MERVLDKRNGTTIKDAIEHMSRSRDFHEEYVNNNRAIREMMYESNQTRSGYENISRIEINNIYRNRIGNIEEGLFDVQNPQRNSSSIRVQNSRSTQTNENDHINNEEIRNLENNNMQEVMPNNGSSTQDIIFEDNNLSDFTQSNVVNHFADETTHSEFTNTEGLLNESENNNSNSNSINGRELDEPVIRIENAGNVNDNVIPQDNISDGLSISIFESIKNFLKNSFNFLYEYIHFLFNPPIFNFIIFITIILFFIYLYFFKTNTIINEYNYYVNIVINFINNKTQDIPISNDSNRRRSSGYEIDQKRRRIITVFMYRLFGMIKNMTLAKWSEEIDKSRNRIINFILKCIKGKPK